MPVIWRAQTLVNLVAWFIWIRSSHNFCVWKGNSYKCIFNKVRRKKITVHASVLIDHCASLVKPDSTILTPKDGLRWHKLLVKLALSQALLSMRPSVFVAVSAILLLLFPIFSFVCYCAKQGSGQCCHLVEQLISANQIHCEYATCTVQLVSVQYYFGDKICTTCTVRVPSFTCKNRTHKNHMHDIFSPVLWSFRSFKSSTDKMTEGRFKNYCFRACFPSDYTFILDLNILICCFVLNFNASPIIAYVVS